MEMRRAKVKYIEVQRKKFEKIIQVHDEKETSSAKICLKGMWFDTEISQGDIVSVTATFNDDRQLFMITNDSGMIVVHPDHLISGTSIVGSIFCGRKAVLAERFRGVDDAGGDSKILMHVGSIVHEILQKSIKENFTSMQEIKNVASDILSSAEIVQMLYSCNASMNQLENDLEPYLVRIFEFIEKFITGKNVDESKPPPCQSNSKPFEGRIAEVKDIEENIWSQRLGLKGKIDITASIYSFNNSKTFRSIVPIEVKTGRPSFSIEHKGQLILYQMMMKDLGQKIDSGLLLYIKDGIIGEVGASRAEESGLIMLRNRFATFMAGNMVERDKTINLPEPISHPSACEKCPYNVLCCSFLKKDSKILIPTHHPLYKVQGKAISHLMDHHFSYFLHWCHLITLEHNEMQKTFKIKHLWTKTPEFRAGKGNALINLRIKSSVLPQNGEFIHQFTSHESSFDFSSAQFEIGDYLIVSM
jgi:DNA replication ATP-dependent helicase Dna2